jgi:flagellar hook-basal body complex protein FliE
MKKSPRLIEKLIILAFILLPSSSSFAATTFKYSGEHGETVYSQTPPKNSNAEQVTVKSKPHTNTSRPSAVEVLEKFTRDNDDKQRAADKKTEEKRLSTTKKKNCTTAKQNLTVYEGPINKLVKDSSGNYKRLNEEERQAKIKAARKNIKEFCH